MGKGGGGRSPNDQRSDSKNPTSDEFRHSMENHYNQLKNNNDDNYDYSMPDSSSVEDEKLLEESERKRQEVTFAENEIKALERESFEIAEQMLDSLFNTYDLASKLKKICINGRGIAGKNEDDLSLSFNEPIMADLAEDLNWLFSRKIPLLIHNKNPGNNPLKKKILDRLGKLDNL